MTSPAPQAQLGQMITGYWKSQAIYAAAKLQIADLLAEGSKSIDELAAATDTRVDLLYRLLRALASLGIFAEADNQQFSLTPLATPLRSDVPGSMHAMALMMGEEHFLAWGNLVETLRTGENAYEKVIGKPIFEYMAEHPEKATIFDAAMTGIHGRETNTVLEAYDFSGIQIIADIGAGNGSKLTAILERYPKMQGMLFDLPHVVERARTNIEAAGLQSRCELHSGSFFQSVPAGADAYLMRHIIHDWDDEQALTILNNCHDAMSDGHKLLLVESVIPPGNDPFLGKFLDLTMMLIPGGKERTEDEYRALYEQAGFDFVRIVPTASEISVLEGIRR